MYIQGKNIKNIRTLSLKRLKTLTACILALAMVFSQISVNALAEEQVSYYDRDTGKIQSVSAEVVTEDLRNWGEAGQTKWYVVKDNITQNNVGGENKRIKVTGDVHLILADNAVLTANPGIEVSEGSSLTIYAQTAEVTLSTGKIIANIQGNPDSAAIGGNDGKACGTIKITGGDIRSETYSAGAIIGGGKGGSGGTITINGGVVNASSTSNGAAQAAEKVEMEAR